MYDCHIVWYMHHYALFVWIILRDNEKESSSFSTYTMKRILKKQNPLVNASVPI